MRGSVNTAMTASNPSGGASSIFERRADLTEDLAMARVRGRLFAQAPAAVRVGRYLVLERLGRGAHGEVHRAWDERLERTVALKLVRPRSAADSRALLDEARALARLVHPNIVSLFDADELPGGQIYLAMELVDGGSLTQWLVRGADVRTRTQLLHAAATGLHAAHRAGLVHRDIKPDNLLITADGRVKLGDFGLARVHDVGDGAQRSPALDDDVAATGRDGALTSAFAGTPLYMAPEQHAGLAIDARADQYALCVVAWSVLLGQPPFVGDSRDALLAAKRRGPDRAAAAALPRRIRSALLQGLAFDPAQRHADVTALITAFGATSRWPWLSAALLVFGVGLAVAATVPAEPAPCDGGAAQLSGVFDDGRRAAIGDAFAALREPYAPVIWDSTARAIDDWTSRWTATHLDVCEAHRRGESSAPLHDARMRCLGRRRGELVALLDRLAIPDGAAAERALAAAHALRAAEPCAVAPIDDGDDTDPATVAQIQALIAAAEAAASTGAHGDARSRADEALVLAEREVPSSWRWRGAALLARGRARSLQGDAAGARDDLEHAARAARRAGDELGLAAAGTELVWEYGEIAGEFALAHLWADFAQIALERAGDDDTIAALLDNARGAVATNERRFDAAWQHHDARLSRVSRVWGREDGRAFASLANLGNVEWARGRPAAALEWYTRARALGETTLGGTHPRVLAMRGNTVGVLRVLGRHGDALAEAEATLAQQVALLGPEHPDVAGTLVNLQTAAQDLGDHRGAIAHGARAVAIIEATAGPRSRFLVPPLTNLAIERALVGDLPAARADLERSFAIHRATHGDGHADTLALLRTAGELELAAGQPRAAAGHFERMHSLAVELGADQGEAVALAQVQWARAEFAAGDVRGARARMLVALPLLIQAPGANALDIEQAEALMRSIDGPTRAHLEAP